jgi:DNA-binding CsgD family transcriptional regulator
MGSAAPPDWDDVFMNAALEPERWIGALDAMATGTGAAHGQLIGIGGARDLPFNLVTNAEGWPFQELIDAGGYRPEANYRIAANDQHVRQGHYDPVLHEAHYDAVMPELSSAIYRDFCETIDIPHGCQTNLVVDGVGLIGLATLRKRREGRTTPAQRRTFAQAAAAARRAVRLQERLEGQQAQLLAGAFEALALTAFIVDARGRLVALTQAAQARLSGGDVTLREGMLDAPGTPWPLSRAVAALIAEDGPAHVQWRVEPADGRLPLFMEGFRLPARAWSLGRLPHAILVVRQPQRDRAGVTAFLTAIYRLTSAEADIAIRLFEGKSRGEIAGERGVTGETLRGQIKSLYAKVGVDGEAALVRVLAAILT